MGMYYCRKINFKKNNACNSFKSFIIKIYYLIFSAVCCESIGNNTEPKKSVNLQYITKVFVKYINLN